LFHDSTFPEFDITAKISQACGDVAGVVDRQRTISHKGRMNCLCKHSQKVNMLMTDHSDHIEQSILDISSKDIPRFKFGWRHVFEGCVWEDLTCHLCLGILVQE